MQSTYSQISLDERRKIARRRQAGVSVEVIAEKLGRYRSTIFRELVRNKFEDAQMPDLAGYFCVVANGMAKQRRSRLRKLARHPRLRAAIIERIKHGWSPEQIAGRLACDRHSVRVCHETIYRFAYSPDGHEIKLWRYLPESRARRRPRHARRRYARRFNPELSILQPPDVVRERQQLGHWECDLIQFRKKFGKAMDGLLADGVGFDSSRSGLIYNAFFSYLLRSLLRCSRGENERARLAPRRSRGIA